MKKVNQQKTYTKGQRQFLPYNPILKKFARELRNKSTIGEISLWKGLKNKQILGYDFHRQKPILNYIVDFYCHELLLAIEIDGDYHNHENQIKKDLKKDSELMAYGITVLRFTEKEAYLKTNMTLQTIETWVVENRAR
jgi:very-short-patch-repair endonuclease